MSPAPPPSCLRREKVFCGLVGIFILLPYLSLLAGTDLLTKVQEIKMEDQPEPGEGSPPAGATFPS